MSAGGSQAAFKGLSSVFQHLPTGTLFLFQSLSPILTNNGKCQPVNRILSSALIFACTISCLLFSISDSYTDSEGNKLFGIATRKGMWLGSGVAGENLSDYRLKVGDLVHALFSLFVFGAVALLDSNTVGCFFPSLMSMQSVFVMAMPPLIGIFSGIVFIMFPNKRHGLRFKRKGGEWTADCEDQQPRQTKKPDQPAPMETLPFQFHQPEEEITSISYFVTNFPENLSAKDLWTIFVRSVGPVVDVTIPGARTRRGTRFAYVRFRIISVHEAQECARRLSCLWLGSYKVVAYPARSGRLTDHYHPAFIPYTNETNAGRFVPMPQHLNGETELHELELGQMKTHGNDGRRV